MFSKRKMFATRPLSIPSLYQTGKGLSKPMKRNPKNVQRFGFCLVEGKSKHPMEDYHNAEFREVSDDVELGLFAIYDGHLSQSVPKYLQTNLFENIIAQREFWGDPRSAIHKAYHVTDKTILDNSRELGVGGSTAVTAILVNGKRLIIGNVGDSRAVLSRSGNAIQLSVDHEPKSEKRSIEKRGGFVTFIPGDVPRVDGQLAVARAFGDKTLKKHLSSEPDTVDMCLDRSDEFLILASDGLWKVMGNQDAVKLIRKVTDPELAAKMLVDAALHRNSKDDISCIVIRFR